MTIWQSIILGIVQGLSEFLPISSSAHLVLVPYILQWELEEGPIFAFDVLVQVATLLAVLAFFWKDLWEIAFAWWRAIRKQASWQEPPARMGWLLVLATIPALLIGFLLKDLVELVFNSPQITAGFLVLTAILLLIAERVSKQSLQTDKLTWLDALWIGLFQALAIFPGVSRSGATITGAMIRHLERPAAARFSFMMSIPVMLAAGLYASLDLITQPGWTADLLIFLPGFIASAITGYLSIRWLLRFLTTRPLSWFAGYCLLVAGVIFVLGFVRGA